MFRVTRGVTIRRWAWQAVEGKGLVARGRVRQASARQDICDVEVCDEGGAVVGCATVVFAVAAPPSRRR